MVLYETGTPLIHWSNYRDDCSIRVVTALLGQLNKIFNKHFVLISKTWVFQTYGPPLPSWGSDNWGSILLAGIKHHCDTSGALKRQYYKITGSNYYSPQLSWGWNPSTIFNWTDKRTHKMVKQTLTKVLMLSGSKVLLRAVRAALYGSHASHKLTVIPMYIDITCNN